MLWCSLFLALMYGCTNTAIEKVRGVEDEYNSVAAAVTTGVLFKSTGDKSSAIRQKSEYQNGYYKKTKHTKFLGKRTFLTPLKC